jgi:hypothetical protein
MLSELQIIRWISVREIALSLMDEYEGKCGLKSCDDCDLCIFSINHRCINNIDSVEGHTIKFVSDTSWCCERGPLMKMVSINNDQIDLVVSIKGINRKEAITWINEQIDDKTCKTMCRTP